MSGSGPYSHLFDNDDIIGQFIADILDELDVEDQAYRYWMNVNFPFPTPPRLRRQRGVHFAPASTVIGSYGSRTNPIVLE